MPEPLYLVHYTRRPQVRMSPWPHKLGTRLRSRRDAIGGYLFLDSLKYRSIIYMDKIKKYIKENYNGFEQTDYVSIRSIRRISQEAELTTNNSFSFTVVEMGEDAYNLRLDIPIDLWNRLWVETTLKAYQTLPPHGHPLAKNAMITP